MISNDFKYFAHRGLHSETVPENSIKAFSEAIANNIAIELDVHITKDGYVVVFHDYNLSRLTGVDAFLEDMTLSEIKKLKLLNTEYTIPTLTEVLTLVQDKVPVLIELKNEGLRFNLEKEVISILNKSNGYYLIQSFNPLSLIYFRKHAKNLKRGQLITESKDHISSAIIRFILKNNILNFISKPNFISYDINYLDKKIFKYYKKRKKQIFSFTINNNELLQKALSLKCDKIIFDTLSLEEIINE